MIIRYRNAPIYLLTYICLLLFAKGRNPLGELVGNPGCQTGLATSFQPVRLVGCSLKALRRLQFAVAIRNTIYTVFRKKHPLTFPFISPRLISRPTDLHKNCKNCSEYSRGTVDYLKTFANNGLKIEHSFNFNHNSTTDRQLCYVRPIGL